MVADDGFEYRPDLVPDKLAEWVTRVLRWVEDVTGLTGLKEKWIIWLTRRFKALVEHDMGEGKLDRRMVQHLTYVFNRALLAIRDFRLTSHESQQFVHNLRRLVRVYSVYRRKSGPEHRKRLWDALEELKSVL